MSDNLIYSHILNNNSIADAATNQRVQSWSDAILSQYNHYFAHTGRALVHILVQMFCGVWGVTAYSIFNTILFIAVVVMFVLYTQNNNNRNNPAIWLLVIFAMFYLFPAPWYLWYIPMMSMNYLLPTFTSLVFLSSLRRWTNKKVGIIEVVLGCVLSFIFGWTHEGFALPISGGLFFWMIINRKTINKQIIPLAVSFWLGAIILTIAPGNFTRLSNVTMVYMLSEACTLYAQVKIVWIALIGCLCYRHKHRTEFQAFVKEHQLILLSLAIAIIFSVKAHTSVWSLTGVEFFSFIIILQLLDRWNTRYMRWQNKITAVVCTCMVAIMGIHQFAIIKAFKEIQVATRNVIATAKANPDDAVYAPDLNFAPYIRPFVDYEVKDINCGDFLAKCVSIGYLDRKPFNLLKKNDYNAVMCPEQFFVEKNRVPGNANAYKGDDYYWIKGDVSQVKSLVFEYYPVQAEDAVNIWQRLKMTLCADSYPSSECFDVDSTLDVAKDRGLIAFLDVRDFRRVKSISIIKRNEKTE